VAAETVTDRVSPREVDARGATAAAVRAGASADGCVVAGTLADRCAVAGTLADRWAVTARDTAAEAARGGPAPPAERSARVPAEPAAGDEEAEEEEEEEAAAAPSSAAACGAAANTTTPAPRATANPPTRPTKLHALITNLHTHLKPETDLRGTLADCGVPHGRSGVLVVPSARRGTKQCRPAAGNMPFSGARGGAPPPQTSPPRLLSKFTATRWRLCKSIEEAEKKAVECVDAMLGSCRGQTDHDRQLTARQGPRWARGAHVSERLPWRWDCRLPGRRPSTSPTPKALTRNRARQGTHRPPLPVPAPPPEPASGDRAGP